MKGLEKVFIIFGLIVFVTFMANHGHINWSGVDLVRDTTTDAINSKEGQKYISETKEISQNLFHDMFYGFKRFLFGNGKNDSTELTEALLLRCVDGDTLIVSIDGAETIIRLIGIDTPESVNPVPSKTTEYGIMTKDYTNVLLENIDTLYLEYDTEKYDKYGRTLAYVWLSDDTSVPENNMLNSILVKNGYADDVVYTPNNKYADLFMSLRETAQDNSIGLWEYKEYVNLRNNN